MGVTFTKLFNQVFFKKEMRILILGLDYSGQTTILYKFKHPEYASVIPTVVPNTETYEYNNISFTFWDVPGSYKIRPFWKHYTENTRGIIFVVDSSDRDRVELARDELHMLMNEELLRDAVLLVFANKQDLPNAMSAEEMTNKLDLHSLKQSHWHIQSSSATSGEGLYEGLEWFSNILASQE